MGGGRVSRCSDAVIDFINNANLTKQLILIRAAKSPRSGDVSEGQKSVHGMATVFSSLFQADMLSQRSVKPPQRFR